MSFGVLNEEDESDAGISEYVVFDPSVRHTFGYTNPNLRLEN